MAWLRWIRGAATSAPRIRAEEGLWHSPPCAEARAAAERRPQRGDADAARAMERALRAWVRSTDKTMRAVHGERYAQILQVIAASSTYRGADDATYLSPDLLPLGATTAERLRARTAIPALAAARAAAHAAAVYRSAGTVTLRDSAAALNTLRAPPGCER
jgi:hypothetical protein